MTSYLPTLCRACAHGNPSDFGPPSSCTAYPDGIPLDISLMADDHRSPRGDEVNGVTFELAPGPEAAEALDDWTSLKAAA